MTRPGDIARLFRDVVATGTRHQLTLDEQIGEDGLLFRCMEAVALPAGVTCPYLESPATPGPFLQVPPAGAAPAKPPRNDQGVVTDADQREYEQRREAWEAHRKLYDELFASRTPSEQYELVVAVGLVEHTDLQGQHHQRHVVVSPAEIQLDQATQRLTVLVADAFRVESTWLPGPIRSPLVEAVDDRSHRPLLEVLADDAETLDGVRETWRRARAVYGQNALWEPNAPPPPGSVALSVEPVVLLRKKDTSHLLALLRDMADDLEAGGHVSGPLTMLTDMTARVDDLPTRTDRPALPRAANDEQRSMLDQARRSPHSIIQGPPGTGKTHTIANLAAVLMAEGRRVLITAENDRALREVQDKLPSSMQPLLLPLLKDKADSGLSRSVSSLIEEADKERRGARPDLEGSLTARRDALEEEAEEIVADIRRVDALEAQEHELNGQRMRLAGHMIALDGYRHDLSLADRYLSDQTASGTDARDLLELHPEVTEADRELARLRLPAGLPDPATFAQQLQDIREKLSRLPDRTDFDHSTLSPQVVQRLENALSRLATLPAVPFASIDRSAGDYSNLAADARSARSGLNHGVTIPGTDPAIVRDYLEAYLNLPNYYTDEPTGLVELHRRAAASTAGRTSVDLQMATSSDPVAAYERASNLVARFATDPTDGLLSRYVTDLRHRGDSSLKHLASHAAQLAEQTGVPPTLPINITRDAPADQELLKQARELRDFLADGGKMKRLIGTPAPVRQAGPLLTHVTLGGSRVDTLEEVEAVRAWLQHRIAVGTARNWAEQQNLTPPPADAQLKDWLTALSRLPDQATDVDKELTDVLQRCHVPTEAHTEPADALAQEVAACAAVRIVDELATFVATRDQLGSGDVRVEGVPVHAEASARIALSHVTSLAKRIDIAEQLPGPWTADRNLHDTTGDDLLAIACDVAAAAAGLPGPARPQTLSESSVRDVLARVQADRRRDEVTTEHTAFLGGIHAALSICTPPSPATELLTDALRREDATAYRDAHAAHVEEAERAERATRLREATERLQQVHPRLVSSFLTGDDDTHDLLGRLGHYQDLLTYRREAQALLAQYPDVRDLHDRLGHVRAEHLKIEADLASQRCWGRAVERLAGNRELSAALSSLQKAERAVPKTKTAKTYQRKLRAMRQATRDAAPAIPSWVMPIDKVAELIGYPTDRADRFDVVIVDEASQAWFPSAFLYAIAEQVVVVGDHLQTSPSDTSVRDDEMVRLLQHHIPRHKLVDKLDGQFSLYDVAAEITSPSVMVDHFRCVPPIIELSNSLCYAQGGQRLQPVRVTEPGALPPLRHVRIAGRRTSAGGANVPEIDAIVERVVACVADSEYDDLTFGVVVVGPRPQAHIKRLRAKLLEALGPVQMEKRQIEVGSPAQYQGAERNVMFLSLVETPDANGTVRLWPHELTGLNLRRIQALNVAVSRAQDQLWIFHSFGPEHLKPGDARHVLLSPPVTDLATTVEAQLAKCQSNFERHVVEALAAHPQVARVRTQVEALGRSIDIVIESYDRRRLAVECDGDAWHTSDEDVARDLYRQRTLEAAGGWRFQRFLASEWYADPDRLLEQTVDLLGEAPVPDAHPPIQGEPDERVDFGETDGAVIQQSVDVDAVEDSTIADASHAVQDAPSQFRDAPSISDELQPPEAEGPLRDQDREATRHPTTVQPEPDGDEEGGPEPTADPVLPSSDREPADLGAIYAKPKAYEAWDTANRLADVGSASRQQLQQGLRQIVEVEGPIVGERLYQLYVKSAGGAKVGSAIKRTLNSAVYRMVRKGELVADDPLGQGGQIKKTYRLPDQPPVIVRELGARTIHDVPPAELAARMQALRQPGERQEETFKRVLNSYGLTRLRVATRETLERAATLLTDDA